jgi:hypothetical protein
VNLTGFDRHRYVVERDLLTERLGDPVEFNLLLINRPDLPRIELTALFAMDKRTAD